MKCRTASNTALAGTRALGPGGAQQLNAGERANLAELADLVELDMALRAGVAYVLISP